MSAVGSFARIAVWDLGAVVESQRCLKASEDRLALGLR